MEPKGETMKKSILFAVVAVFLGLILWITVDIYQSSNKYLANKTSIFKSKETDIENNAGRFVWDAGNVFTGNIMHKVLIIKDI